MRTRLEATGRLVILVALEAAAVPLLRGTGTRATTVDWSHVGRWLANSSPDDAVVAAVRLVGLALAGWLLATTTLYLLARLTRLPGLLRTTEWLTLPGVRRIVDAAVAASVLGGAVLAAHPAGAQAGGPPPIVVELNSTTTTTTPSHLYVPVPAGDGAAPILVPTTAPSTTVATPVAPTTTATPSLATTAQPYRVVAGDNLWTIAKAELSRQTGRAPEHLAEVEIRNYWIKVIEGNRSHLRSGDPNLIFPGESVLRPPAG
jgi:hypothetical protein